MRTADSDYILALHNGAPVVNYATFILYDGTRVPLKPQDFRLSGNTFTDRTTDGNSFSVGSFIGKTVNICIDNTTGKFDNYDFYMSRFILNEAVPVGNNVVKQVSIGNFTVVTDYTPGSIINFSGVDDSYLFDKPHNLTGVKTLKEIIQTACSECLGSQTFDGTGNFDLYSTQINTNKLDAKLTWRQIVSYIAIMTGYNAYIDADEILRFKWYDYSVFGNSDLDGGTFDTHTTPYSDGDVIDGGNFTNYSSGDAYDGGTFNDVQDYHIIQSYKSFQLGTYDISITGVRVVNGDTVVEKLSVHTYNYSYVIEVKDNPLCEGIENTIAKHLGTKLNDFTFRIFSCDVLCNPLIEAGDMALVIDTKGTKHKTLINDVSFQTNGYTKIACKAENIIRQQAEYSSPVAKAIVEANRNTARQLSAYDESVQRMNRLAQNANGLYTGRVEKADGSVVYYESDHEITYWPDGSAKFVNHSHVWKNTNMGHFYSTDSGTSDLGEYPGSTATTWIGGVDRDGNAVMNTVAAIGLLADWIIAGEMTIGGSKTNPQNAVITVKDEHDDTICTINKNGITMHQGLIQSPDYEEETPVGTFSDTGMMIDVLNSILKSPFFALNNNGAYLKGEIQATSGQIGGATISSNAITVRGDIELYNGGGSSFDFAPYNYRLSENFSITFYNETESMTITIEKYTHGSSSPTIIETLSVPADTPTTCQSYLSYLVGQTDGDYYHITSTATSSWSAVIDDAILAYMGEGGFKGFLQGIFEGYIESEKGKLGNFTYSRSGIDAEPEFDIEVKEENNEGDLNIDPARLRYSNHHGERIYIGEHDNTSNKPVIERYDSNDTRSEVVWNDTLIDYLEYRIWSQGKDILVNRVNDTLYIDFNPAKYDSANDPYEQTPSLPLADGAVVLIYE